MAKGPSSGRTAMGETRRLWTLFGLETRSDLLSAEVRLLRMGTRFSASWWAGAQHGTESQYEVA
jgi:hypothetical protein